MVRADEAASVVLSGVEDPSTTTDAEPDPDLRRREARAGGVAHRVGEVGDQLAQLPVEVDDLDGAAAQHRVTEEADGLALSAKSTDGLLV